MLVIYAPMRSTYITKGVDIVGEALSGKLSESQIEQIQKHPI